MWSVVVAQLGALRSALRRRRDVALETPVDGELVAQREDVELEDGPRSEGSAEGGEESDEDGLHGRRTLPYFYGTERDCWRGTCGPADPP
jgi:hypothetical protein